MTMTDKTLLPHTPTGAFAPLARWQLTPWLLRLSRQVSMTGRAEHAKPVALELLPQQTRSVFLQRNTWLVVQHGSCVITLPMQWQAERLVHSQITLHEGDAWQVPHSSDYQLRQSEIKGDKLAAVRMVLLSKRT